MSLYGALFSGVSGLVAQSSAMGAISDNITNVSTVGYKNTAVSFQTLVTKQTSTTFYSAGGVQSKPLQATDVQGLLQASTSQTDISISGNGFFVVNEANVPTVSDQFLYTRSGAFTMDNEGYLKNSAGFFLQGWPTQSDGTVKVANPNAGTTIANQNIISTDFLSTINLNRVGGTASSTENIAIGANLPSNDTVGVTHRTDVQFFDTLGNANTVSIVYTKPSADNEWKMSIEPPSGATDLKIEDSVTNMKTYRHVGQIEFNIKDAAGAGLRPADGASMTTTSNGVTRTYIFDNNASVTNATAETLVTTLGGVVAVNDRLDMNVAGQAITYTTAAGPAGAGTAADVAAGMAAAINANATAAALVSATASGAVLTITAKVPGATGFVVGAAPSWGVDGNGGNTVGNVAAAGIGADNTFKVDVSGSTTVAGDVAALLAAIRASDPNFDSTNTRVNTSTGSSTSLVFEDDGLASMTIDPTALKATDGTPVTTQTQSFTINKRDTLYTDYTQLKFTAVPANAETIVINGVTYTFTTGQAEDSTGADTTIFRDGPLDRVLADLEAAIETNDPNFSGNDVYVRASDNPHGNTLVIESLPNGSNYTISTANLASNPTEPDGTSTVGSSIYTATNTITVQTEPAISFSSGGLPNGFNVAELEINNFANGAANMDDDANNAKQISLDFGTVAEANGMTQFGAEFTPVFISQNGSRFGTFAGLTVNTDGLVTALFDNGETRNIFKIPMATFVNPNQLGGRTGNVWNATEASGDYTLREADNGPAGQVIQAALEASTVDIGAEFTNMIVVQRAYSASTKIISTADEMLEELMRTKR